MEQLTKEEMAVVKGGGWIYDKETKQWVWIEMNYGGDPDEPGSI